MELRLVWLLRAAWFVGTLPILVASIPYSRLSLFHGVLLEFAKRGKIMQSSSSSHKFTVPQIFFLHFYVLAVAWTTILLLSTWFYVYKMAPLGSESLHYSMVASHLTGGSHILSLHKSHSISVAHRFRVWDSVILLVVMEIHGVRRLYETIYVFKYGRSARMTFSAILLVFCLFVRSFCQWCHLLAQWRIGLWQQTHSVGTFLLFEAGQFKRGNGFCFRSAGRYTLKVKKES